MLAYSTYSSPAMIVVKRLNSLLSAGLLHSLIYICLVKQQT